MRSIGTVGENILDETNIYMLISDAVEDSWRRKFIWILLELDVMHELQEGNALHWGQLLGVEILRKSVCIAELHHAAYIQNQTNIW